MTLAQTLGYIGTFLGGYRVRMFCRFCGSTLRDGSNFCHSCGKPLTLALPSSIAGTDTGAAVVPVKPAPPKTKKPPALGSFVIGVLLIVGVLWWFMSKSDSGSSSPSTLRQLVAQPRTEVLSNGEFALSATQYRYVRFEVPQNAGAVRVEGTFSASGGGGNDIEAYVFSNDDFVNWQNRHRVRTFYNSGRVTQGTLEVMLPPIAGTYYLVFNNNFSLFSAKTVQTSIRLHFNL
jgi:zinc-ribbon domain